MKTWKAVMLTVAAVVLMAVAAFFLFVYSGVYNVAASAPHSALEVWTFNRVAGRSIQAHSANVKLPSNLAAPERVAEGAEHYAEMCVVCHGAPGVDRSEIGQGLNPLPPNLAQSATDLDAPQLFWIVKNGIKMTGMPAFGATHSDDAVWDITAFVRQLPKMTPEDYARRTHETSGQHTE